MVLSTHSLTLASGGRPIFLLVIHQPAFLSIWPSTPSLRWGLSTNPGVAMWWICGWSWRENGCCVYEYYNGDIVVMDVILCVWLEKGWFICSELGKGGTSETEKYLFKADTVWWRCAQCLYVHPYWKCGYFVMQVLYVCVSCGSYQCSVLHDLQFVNAGRGYHRRPYERGDIRKEPTWWRSLLWALDIWLVLYEFLPHIPPSGMPIISMATNQNRVCAFYYMFRRPKNFRICLFI